MNYIFQLKKDYDLRLIRSEICIYIIKTNSQFLSQSLFCSIDFFYGSVLVCRFCLSRIQINIFEKT